MAPKKQLKSMNLIMVNINPISQHESDHGQQEHNQNLNAKIQVNEDDDPMEEEMSDDKFFHDKSIIV
jgi:hypothetical protein